MRFLAAFTFTFIILLTINGLAVAHTDLFSTEPEAGAVVEDIEAIQLYFTTPLSEAEVRVLHDSEAWPTTTAINESTTHVTASLDAEPEAGLYQVIWAATAEDDGHSISGSFNFEVEPSESGLPIPVIGAGVAVLAVLIGVMRRALKAA